MARGKHYLVAVDESFIDPAFYFGVLYITEKQIAQFDRKWNQLRAKIRAELLRDAPRRADHEKLMDGQLPEIHAVAMWQSEDYYRLKASDPGFRPDYWMRQIRWTEEALEILRSCNVRFMALSDYIPLDFQTANRKKYDLLVSELMLKYLGRDYPEHRRKYAELIASPYFLYFAQIIAGCDEYFSKRSASAYITVDRYDACKGFSENEMVEQMIQSGLLKSIRGIDEADSAENNLVQAADVITYVYARATHGYVHHRIDAKSTIANTLFRRHVQKMSVSPSDVTFDREIADVIQAGYLDSKWPIPSTGDTGGFAEGLVQILLDAEEEVDQLSKRFLNEPDPFRRRGPSDPRLAAFLNPSQGGTL